jgi:SNF family Na+-dependent transporter
MFNPDVVKAIALIIAVSTAVIIFKNFLANLKESDSTIKNVTVILLVLILLVGSVLLYGFGTDLETILAKIMEEGVIYTQSSLKILNDRREHIENIITKIGVIQLISGSLLWVLLASINKEIKKGNKNKKDLWDWDKIRN